MLLFGVVVVIDFYGDVCIVVVGERVDKKINYFFRRMKVGKVR